MSHLDDTHRDLGEEPDLSAGDFSDWMVEMQGALRGERGSDVPCGGCTACCTSSQFIDIAPDERDTLTHIPAELLFAAPGLWWIASLRSRGTKAVKALEKWLPKVHEYAKAL